MNSHDNLPLDFENLETDDFSHFYDEDIERDLEQEERRTQAQRAAINDMVQLGYTVGYLNNED